MRHPILTLCIVSLPWEIGLGIWAGTAGHTLTAAFLLAAAIVTIMEISNSRRPF